MSHTAHIPSHRKPRRNASKTALRAGVAGGVLSTIAVAACRRSGPGRAGDPDHRDAHPHHRALHRRRRSPPKPRSRSPLDLETAGPARTPPPPPPPRPPRRPRPRPCARRRPRRRRRRPPRPRPRPPCAPPAPRPVRRSAPPPAPPPSPPPRRAPPAPPRPSSRSSRRRSATRTCRRHRPQLLGLLRPGPGRVPPVGVDLPRVSQAQSTAGTQVSLSNLQPGDILYWGGAGSAYHVGVYVGGGQFVGAQNPSTGVVLRSLDYDPPSGAVRVL